MKARAGFTLIELLIFTAIFAVVMAGAVTMLISISRIQGSQSSVITVQSEAQQLIQQIQYYLQDSGTYIDTRSIKMTTYDVATTTYLWTGSGPSGQYGITVTTGTVYYYYPCYLLSSCSTLSAALHSNKVKVSNLSFTPRLNRGSSSTLQNTMSVDFSFTMSANTSNTNKAYSQTFNSSGIVTRLFPKMYMTTSAGSSSLSAVTSRGVTLQNSSGNALIAVVQGNATTAVSVSISDTAGNTWTRVGTTTAPAKTSGSSWQLGNPLFTYFYYSKNIQAASNTITATAASPGMSVFSFVVGEFSGLSTSSPFDASGTTQLYSTATPSTTLSNLSGGVELIFVNMLPSYTSWPSVYSVSVTSPAPITSFWPDSISTGMSYTLSYITSAISFQWSVSNSPAGAPGTTTLFYEAFH